MTENKGTPTPGPWNHNGLKPPYFEESETAEAKKERLACAVWTADGEIPICSTRFQVGRYRAQSAEIQDANARLIVRAVNFNRETLPEVIAFLQQVSAHYCDTDAPMGITARKILARLEGGEK